jgi:glycosyltransferase involved in cell wall biosynthesis
MRRSVVLPTDNRVEMLGSALAALLRQSAPGVTLEIVVLRARIAR